MKELDVNTTLKNVIEQEKLQQELNKLSRSGEFRALFWRIALAIINIMITIIIINSIIIVIIFYRGAGRDETI
jgi:hypothetical protein